jgi:hypothetical protein
MLARLGRALLIAAVLLAQQTALGHQYWHASKAVSADAKKAPKGDLLCDFHDLLATVLGLAGGSAQALAFLALAEPGFIASVAIVREAALLHPRSRGPPLHS